MRKHRRRHRTSPKVAPEGVIQRDFYTLKTSETLRVGWETEQLVLLYGVLSHAHEGHVRFDATKYPNTTFADITHALRLSTDSLYQYQRDLLAEVAEWVERVLSGEKVFFCRNRSGEPLFRFPHFYFWKVNPDEVLRGLYLGGLRDDPDVRAVSENRYHFRVGGGRMYPVDQSVMDQLNLDGERLAREAHEQELPRFRQVGLIVTHGEEDDVYPMYIRHRVGRGASDDAAILAAGKIYSFDTAVGVFLADLMDTLEKGLPDYGDLDYALGIRIETEFKNLQLTREDVYRLVYFAAQPEDDEEWPDCSLRHFLRVDRQYELCAIECHFLHLLGEPTPNLRIGKRGYEVHRFYQKLTARLGSL